MTDFEKAVALAKDKLKIHIEGDRALLAMRVWFIKANPEGFLAEALDKPQSFDKALNEIAFLMERDGDLPIQIRQWLVRYLRGKIERPKGKVGRDEYSYSLKLVVHECVSDLNLHFNSSLDLPLYSFKGLQLARNVEGKPTSACDAVAQAMGELKLSPSTFEGIKRIYYEVQKEMREAAVLEAENDHLRSVERKFT